MFDSLNINRYKIRNNIQGLHQLEAMERTLKWSILGGWFIFNIFLIIVLCNIVKLRKKFAYGDFDRESMPQSIRHSQASLKEHFG